MYKDLPYIWQEAFQDAWTSFCEGTLPIAAIIADRDGNILSRGRNRIYCSDELNPKMNHAEMNAMRNLDTKKYQDIRSYILYTTMEPCPMCMGTATMVNLRHIRYAAHDDYCGTAHLAFDDRYISGKNIDISFEPGMEEVQLTLQTAFDFIRGNRVESNTVNRSFRKRCPEAFTAAAKIFEDGTLARWLEKKTSVEEVYDAVEALCEEIRMKNQSLLYTARIEQTKEYQKRMKYIREKDSFVEKDCDSLSYVRNVPEPYGWITESGTPPERHLDVIIMSDKAYALGDTENVRIIGVFRRNDGDHKLVAVPIERNIVDFFELTEAEKADMHRLYPKEDPGEGWFGVDKAKETIDGYFGLKKGFYKSRGVKRIYLIQHCESEHHLNGMVGAWTNWNLTERGREQARLTGEWLLSREFAEYKKEQEALEASGCSETAKSFPLPYTQIYCSPLNRAAQTAEEMMKSLDAPIVYRDEIREVNAGMAHGHTNKWLRENEGEHPEHFSADYRSFPDADSDRDLWNRIWPFYQEILHCEAQNVIIVSHGCTLSFLQNMLMGHTDVTVRARFAPHGPAGSISKFDLNDAGRMSLDYLNRRACD